MRHIAAFGLLVLALAACGSADGPATAHPGVSAPSAQPFAVTPVHDFAAPWAMAFLPDGRVLVTEKAGQLKLLSGDFARVVDVAGLPPVDSAGQGGLMDVAPSPDFARSGRVYFSYSAAGAGGKGVVLARGRLVEANGTARLDGVETLFRGHPLVEGDGHYSGRIAFSPDGFLFFTNGERQKFTPAQDPKSTLGKVLRLTMDGKAAPGNPLAADGFDPAIWSYGHRNLLGIAFAPDGKLWEIEMGPKGGDEVNLISAGRNYGWPVVSNGDNYDGSPIPDHPTRPEFEAPRVWWNPSISPAGLMVYTGAMFPQWRGSLFVPALSGKALVRVAVEGDQARKAEQWNMGARIRAVGQGPDGAIYLLEDGGRGSEGRMLRLTTK